MNPFPYARVTVPRGPVPSDVFSVVKWQMILYEIVLSSLFPWKGAQHLIQELRHEPLNLAQLGQ